MSANNDAMTRFLFAILQQKNLKDIDWNQVAKDPNLAQPITNGHAARMRFSRFRTAMLGLEPTRRNRTQGTSRVSKSKKDPKAKKGETVKSESAPESPATRESSEAPAPKIKQESAPYGFENRLTPRLTPGPPGPMSAVSTPGVIQPRLLTPCSDADLFSPSPVLTSSPASERINPQNSFDFRGSPCPDHVDPMWASVPFSPFTASYSFDDYGAGHCEHPHMHPHSDAHGLPLQTVESDEDYVDVKREWDQYH